MFFIQWDVEYAVQQKVLKYIANFPVPFGSKAPRYFRSIEFIGTEFDCWHIVNSKTYRAKEVKELSKKQQKLSEWDIISYPDLAERIESGWKPEDWTYPTKKDEVTIMDDYVDNYLLISVDENELYFSFFIQQEKPFAIGEKMNEINENAYMNGYNWEASSVILKNEKRKAEQNMSRNNFIIRQSKIIFWNFIVGAVFFGGVTIAAILFPDDTATWWIDVFFFTLSFGCVFMAYYCKC